MKHVLILVTLLFSQAAFGAELLWQNFRVAGGGSQVGCTYNSINQDIYWTSVGGDLSFLFTKLGITLEAMGFSGFKMTASTSCTIDAHVTIPQGYYVSTVTQVLQGGILKDRGTIAGITSNSYLFTNQVPLNQINIYSPSGQRIDQSAPMLVQTNIHNLDLNSRNIQCATTRSRPLVTNFRLNVAAVATRALPMQRVIINVDSNDLTYHLTPSLLPCN